jgi:murein DD-endopeptidase MepM/ murein hydrolase activator NlpD
MSQHFFDYRNLCKGRIARSFLIALLGANLLSGCTHKFSDPAEVEYDATVSPYHKVKRNETLASIARKYDMNKQELARLNGIKPPYRIAVGQKLLVKPRTKKRVEDDYDTPATEVPAGAPLGTTGEVKVNKLAPFPGTQDESISRNELEKRPLYPDPEQPFAAPAPSGAFSSTQYQEDPTDASDEGEVKKAQTEKERSSKILPSPPKSTSFYSWPVKGKVIRNFEPGKKGHSGIKISSPLGTAVRSSNNGIVARAQQIRGYGKLVLIKHDNGVMTIYAHLDSISVKRGDVVSAGQQIGTVGKSGNVREPQLHFAILEKQGKVPVDPEKLLD